MTLNKAKGFAFKSSAPLGLGPNQMSVQEQIAFAFWTDLHLCLGHGVPDWDHSQKPLYRNVTFRYTLTFWSIKVLKYGLQSNSSIGKNLEELGYNTMKKRNQTGYRNRNYMRSKYVLKSGLHLMRVTGTGVRTLAILEYTTAGIKKKMVWYVRRMLWLKFYVLISGLLMKYKCQNVGYIIQILNKLSWKIFWKRLLAEHCHSI